MLELYHSGLTTCSKQVRLALAEKALAYVSRYVELFRHEQLSPPYLALNPWGVVPTLVHDGHAIVNSAAINEYLDDVFPDPPLRPADPRARARMRLWTWAADEVHPALADVTYNALLRPKLARFSEAELGRLFAHMPAPERRERVRRVAGGGFDRHEIALAFERLAFVIARAEADLAHGPYLAGETYSLGDVSMLAIVRRVGELRPEMVDRSRVPHIADWLARVGARPAVQKVYADGTEETPPRPERHTLDALS